MKSNQKLVLLLSENKYHITTCESCTGGLIASSIIDISGSSAVIDEAYVTYAASSKVGLVGVDAKLIEKYGVVSSEVACDMALKAGEKAKAEFAISATGVAGPTGGDDVNPVGTIWFGFKIFDNVFSVKKVFGGKTRNEVRRLGANFAIRHMYKLINSELKMI